MDFARAQPVVDRHEQGAELGAGKQRFNERVAVQQQGRDPVAFLSAPAGQRLGQAVAALVELRIAFVQAFEDQGRLIRALAAMHRQPVTHAADVV